MSYFSSTGFRSLVVPMFGRSHANITKHLCLNHRNFENYFYYQSKERGDLFAMPTHGRTTFKFSPNDASYNKYDADVTFHQEKGLLIIEFDKEKPIHTVVDCNGVFIV
jgi:hypothetical protein